MGGCFGTGAAERIEDDHARDEGGELCVAGFGEFALFGVQQECRNIPTRGVGCFFDEFPRWMVDPRGSHSRSLRTLPGVGENDHDSGAFQQGSGRVGFRLVFRPLSVAERFITGE